MPVPISLNPRITNMLTSNIVTSNIHRNSSRLFDVQRQMSTGREIPTPSFDPSGAGLTIDLQSYIEKKEQQEVNIQSAESFMAFTDDVLDQVNGLIIEARSIALGYSDPSTPESRMADATAIGGIIDQLSALASSTFAGRYIFGGTETETAPFTDLHGGIAYLGNNESMEVNVGFDSRVGINVTANAALGAGSKDIGGSLDLDPGLDADTRLAWLNNGRGVAAGTIRIDDGAGTTYTVELTDAATIGDVMDRINAVAPATIGAAIGPANNNLVITSTVGDPVISEFDGGTTANDLGILGAAPPASGQFDGADLDPALTDLTKVANLNGGAGLALNRLRIENGSFAGVVDLSGAVTMQDVIAELRGAGAGIDVQLNDDGRTLSVRNTISGADLSIGEDGPGDTTAATLGIRSLNGDTLLESLNHGRGVNTTGRNDAAFAAEPDIEFTTTVPPATFGVDLDGAVTVQDAIDRINAAAIGAGVGAIASLNETGNGIRIAGAAGTYTCDSVNGTTAARDLGIEQTAAVGFGQDGVNVGGIQTDSVFTTLSNLREALLNDDRRTVQESTEILSGDLNRILEARGQLGARMSRTELMSYRIEQDVVEAKTLLSNTFDLDYTNAIANYENRRGVFEASIQTATQLLNISILDYLR